MDYLKDPAEIYRLSAERVRDAVRDQQTGNIELSDALIRMIHACADPMIAEDFRQSQNADNIGRKALMAGAPILCDCTMVQRGIITSRLQNNPLICTLNEPSVKEIASDMATTRSAAAVTLWKPHLKDSIVVIGNAPTALFQLLDMIIQQAAPRPALIVGMPVGFVGATESKDALNTASHQVPYMTLLGRKGGSAIAAAAINSLAGALGS